MNSTLKTLLAIAVLAMLIAFSVVSRASGEEAPAPPPPEIDPQLLDGLDDLPPRRDSKADIAGEDLGATKPTSTLADLAQLMRGVQQRMRRQDTSAVTTQLQADIAAQLAKMLAAAERDSTSQSSAAASNDPSDQTSSTDPEGSDADPRLANGERDLTQADLLDAVWGALPERLRQQIQSPLQEDFLPRYERVIKQYYKRLAEEQRRLRN